MLLGVVRVDSCGLSEIQFIRVEVKIIKMMKFASELAT